MDRRNFIKLTASLGLATTPVAMLACGAEEASPDQAETNLLPIPPRIEVAPDKLLKLEIAQSHYEFLPGKSSASFGINGPLLGPTLVLRQQQDFKVQITNNLDEDAVIHWHGLICPGHFDGGPHNAIKPRQTGPIWQTKLTSFQKASTLWYHAHPHGRTAYQTAMGIGGLLLIEDAQSDLLAIPKTYGVDDIPVVMQDKRLDANGQISYQLNETTAAVGWIGNHMLVNGAINPVQPTPKAWIRLRLLNGCNARVLNVRISDKRPMFVIASDGGFLDAPAKVKTLEILPGERFEVMVDARDGTQFDLVSMVNLVQPGMAQAPFDKTVSMLTIKPVMATTGVQQLPTKLVDLPATNETKATETKKFLFNMTNMRAAMEYESSLDESLLDRQLSNADLAKLHKINGVYIYNATKSAQGEWEGGHFDMTKPLFDVPIEQYQIWEITQGHMDDNMHPFHVHGTQFRILEEKGVAPEPHRCGWKDTARIGAGQGTKVLVYFGCEAPKEHPYMIHCHLLEHEDTGMMAGFTVSKA